jgi:cobalt/nickel transport system permease protein
MRRPGLRRRWWVAGLAMAGLIVVLLVPLASPHPDGLERIAEDQGFLGQAQTALFSILPDYTVPGLEDTAVTTIAAGLIGVVLVFLAMWGLGALLTRRRRAAQSDRS